ncbi:MAG: hypothetical protein ACOYX5_15585 [Actinomycetota bacterium]
MTQTLQPRLDSPTAAPYSSLVRVAAGACLVAAAVTNGLSQYAGDLATGGVDFADQLRWGLDHPVLQRTEQSLLVVSALFMPLGLLGLAQVTRWSARRLTLVATPLFLLGMWGFANVLSMGYVTGTIAPQLIPVGPATTLHENLGSDPGAVWLALVPHLVGSFFGVLLITVAAWRSGRFPRPACALVIAFLVWDFLLPSVGPLEPHLLLAVGWAWLGVVLIRMPQAVWAGASR